MDRFLLHIALAYAAAVAVSPLGFMIYSLIFEHEARWGFTDGLFGLFLIFAVWLLPGIIVYQLTWQLRSKARWWHEVLYFALASPMFWMMLWAASYRNEATDWGRLLSIMQGLGILAAYGMLRWLHRRPVTSAADA